MKRKLFLLVQVFLASMMTVVNAQTFDAEKTYTIECYNQGGKYMQDNGDGYIVPKAFNDNSYWYLVPTGTTGCYYVKNAVTNRYMQKTSEYQVSVKTGDTPVEICIKNDPAKGTNVYALASTDQDLSFSGDKTYGANYTEAYVQGFKANLGANPNSFWKIVEAAMPGTEPETGHALSADKIYTIVCKPDFNTFMQDNGTGGLLLGAESAGTLWRFEPTENANCYYVKNVKTGNYIQACPDLEDENNPIPVTMGTTPVEYYVKGDAAGGQAGENFFRMTSTDRTPHDYSEGTIGLNRSGDNTLVQGFKSVIGANQWSVWCIREVEMVQQTSLSSPFTGSEVQEGIVYLYNVESGKWLQNNNRFNPDLTAQYWTTRAELGDWGLDINLVAQGDGYQIDPNFINNHSINDFNLYMDTNQPVTSWKFTPKSVAGITNAYTIEAEKATLGSDVNGYLRGADLGATTWQVVTLDERLQYAQNNASETNPIDMTFLVPNPDLSNNNERAAWVVTRDGGEETWNDVSRFNRIFWSKNFNSLDVSQTVTNIPNGTYQVTFSLLYCPVAVVNSNLAGYNDYVANGEETVYLAGYANGESIKARSYYSEKITSYLEGVHQKQIGDYYFPGTPDQVNGAMGHGYYQTEPLTVTVTDGTLKLGIKSLEGCPTTAWIGFSGIKLSYLGAAEESLSVTVSDALYATYVAPCDVDFTGCEVGAYAAQINDAYVHLEPVTTVPAGTAVVVKADAAGTYTINSTTSASFGADNDLVAATADVTADGTQYALAKLDGEVGFYKVSAGTSIHAGKGYLVISGAGVKEFYGFDADDTTGIENLNDNANLNGIIYNVAGQRIQEVQKGINVVNGKKIVR